MSLPDGVTTCLVTYGPITDTFGNPADSITVEVVADRTIVHAASGRTLFKNPVSVTADSGGIAQIPVPHTNQSGFRDQQQNALTGWYYIVRLTARFGTAIQTDSKTFQPLVGQVVIDADLLSSSGMVTPGVTAPTGVVTSVAGQTGTVTADQIASAVLIDTGWRDLIPDNEDALFRVCRIGPITYYDFAFAGAAESAFNALVPAGFRPKIESGGSIYDPFGEAGDGYRIYPNGDFETTSGNPIGSVRGSGSFPSAGAFPSEPYAGTAVPF